jgi:hypothetical protein
MTCGTVERSLFGWMWQCLFHLLPGAGEWIFRKPSLCGMACIVGFQSIQKCISVEIVPAFSSLFGSPNHNHFISGYGLLRTRCFRILAGRLLNEHLREATLTLPLKYVIMPGRCNFKTVICRICSNYPIFERMPVRRLRLADGSDAQYA